MAHDFPELDRLLPEVYDQLPTTVKRDTAMAKAWLIHELGGGGSVADAGCPAAQLQLQEAGQEQRAQRGETHVAEQVEPSPQVVEHEEPQLPSPPPLP